MMSRAVSRERVAAPWSRTWVAAVEASGTIRDVIRVVLDSETDGVAE